MAESEEYNVVPTRSIHPSGRSRGSRLKLKSFDAGLMMKEQHTYCIGSRTSELSERIQTKLRQMELAMRELSAPSTPRRVSGSKQKGKVSGP